MIHYFQVEVHDPHQLDKLGISMNAIGLSLLFAVAHTLIELIFLKLNAIACQTTILHYIVVCLNGSFGWVPFTNKFTSLNGPEDLDLSTVLDYDNINTKFCGQEVKVYFEFCESTCDNLIKALGSLPIQINAKNRIKIKFG